MNLVMAQRGLIAGVIEASQRLTHLQDMISQAESGAVSKYQRLALAIRMAEAVTDIASSRGLETDNTMKIAQQFNAASEKNIRNIVARYLKS